MPTPPPIAVTRHMSTTENQASHITMAHDAQNSAYIEPSNTNHGRLFGFGFNPASGFPCWCQRWDRKSVPQAVCRIGHEHSVYGHVRIPSTYERRNVRQVVECASPLALWEWPWKSRPPSLASGRVRSGAVLFILLVSCTPSGFGELLAEKSLFGGPNRAPIQTYRPAGTNHNATNKTG